MNLLGTNQIIEAEKAKQLRNIADRLVMLLQAQPKANSVEDALDFFKKVQAIILEEQELNPDIRKI